MASDDHLDFMMAVAELGGGAAFLPSEDAVEVAHVVVSAFEADLGNGVGGVDQHPRGVAQAYVYDVVAQPPSGVQLEETAEGALARGACGCRAHRSRHWACGGDG